VTFSPNLTMSGYNSWLTTCALWRRIVDLMRKPAVALLDWCQGGIRRLGLRDRDDWHDRAGRVPSLHCAIPTPSSHKAPIANSGGAIVARSRILVSGSTATLLGTMTNETGFDVYFSGLPPPCHRSTPMAANVSCSATSARPRGRSRPVETG